MIIIRNCLRYTKGSDNDMKLNTQSKTLQRYDNLDGLRTLAAISIICMHIKYNLDYDIIVSNRIIGYVINNLIASAGVFVQLFFVISGFSMCCGYYEKIKNNQISLNRFYSRRYSKILPFFALLVFIDLAMAFVFEGGVSKGIIYEAIADLTLMFGLFPANNITVIGVGWTLGVIFGFYILFPFFVFLIWNKKRAWFSFSIMIIINYLCSVYFLSNGTAVGANTLRWICFFVAGGLIYLYKDSIENIYQKMGKRLGTAIGIALVFIGIIITQIFNVKSNGNISMLINTLKNIFCYSIVVIGAIGFETVIWSNPFSKFISKISLEIYLSHMLVFRFIEKLGLTKIAGEGILSYVLVCICTIIGVLLFAYAYQLLEKAIINKFGKIKKCNAY